MVKFFKPISKNGIYKSVFPDFVTNHLESSFLSLSSMFFALTYGGLPTIRSKPSFSFIELHSFFQSKSSAFPTKRLKWKLGASSPSKRAKRDKSIFALLILYELMSKPKIFSSTISLYDFSVAFLIACATVTRKPPQPQEISLTFILSSFALCFFNPSLTIYSLM